MNAPPQSNGANGYGRTNGANGYANGTNGHTNGASHPNGHTASPPAQNGHPGANPEPLEPIAIVGMAMRLPGGVHDADAYWDLLVNKRSGQCTVPKDRYNVEAWYGPGKIGHVTSKQGYFLEELDLGNIDLSFWTMTKQEVEVMDPQQRLMLEVVYECLQNAGQKNWKGRNIGCYLGTFEGDWLELDGRDPQNGRIHRLTGYGDYMVANRVSYEFGFVGPRYCSYSPREHLKLKTADTDLKCNYPDGMLGLTYRPTRCMPRSLHGRVRVRSRGRYKPHLLAAHHHHHAGARRHVTHRLLQVLRRQC